MIYISSLDKVVYATTSKVGKGLQISNQYLQSTNAATPSNTIKISYNNVAKNQGYLTWKNSAGNSCRNVMQGSYGKTSSTYTYSSSWTEKVAVTFPMTSSDYNYIAVYLNADNDFLYRPYYIDGIRIRSSVVAYKVTSNTGYGLMSWQGDFGTVQINSTYKGWFPRRNSVSLVYTANTKTFSTIMTGSTETDIWAKVSISKFETLKEPHSGNTFQAWLSLNISYNYEGTVSKTSPVARYVTETFTNSKSDTKYTLFSSSSKSSSYTSTY